MINNNNIWPTANMEFEKINDNNSKVNIKWSHNYFNDYKKLSHQFFECGYAIIKDVIDSGHDNIKCDTWFLTGIFLLRHSLELGIKALICRVSLKNRDIQDTFRLCCHNLSKLFIKYLSYGENFLTNEENDWLKLYFDSIETVDEKSDMFRFPFDDVFLSKYESEFLDIEKVSNNMIYAFYLINKCLEKKSDNGTEHIYKSNEPEFFIFSDHGICNCYLWQSPFDNGYHVKIEGYKGALNFIYENVGIKNEDKCYPLMFMFRNTIELCLKLLLDIQTEYTIDLHISRGKKKSHLIKKDLWNNVKKIVENYNESNSDEQTVKIVENQIEYISSMDKKGDNFRYPTSYSLEYRIDNKSFDIDNVFEYQMAIINFLYACSCMLEEISNFESYMKHQNYCENLN